MKFPVRYKRSLGAFLHMILEPAAYIPSHPRAYGLMILGDKATPEQRKWLNEEQVQALGRVKKTPWADQAVKYAKQVSKAMGWSTKKELQLFLQTGAGLSDPGEKISIAPVLREILAEQREAREAQDRKETNETLPAKRNTRN